MKNVNFSRREFIRRTAVAPGLVAAAHTILLEPGPSYAAAAPVPPSDTVRFGIVGVGMEGTGLLRTAISIPGVECVAACDLYDGRHEVAREIVGKPIFTTRQYQKLLDNKEIDCIVCATPDHWHTQVVVDSCNAGKDVYVEKPMTHSAREGFDVIAAAQRNSRIVQVGSQAASSVVYAKAKELIAKGALGDVHLVESIEGRNDPNGAWQYPPPLDLSPQNLDWDTWLGKAPKIPFNPQRFACWRGWRVYGTGVAGDLFVHMLTGIHFAAGINEPPQRALATGGLFRWKDGRDVPDVHSTLFDYPQFPVSVRVTLNTEHPGVTRFLGTHGLLEIGDDQCTLTHQDGIDRFPGWYYPSFPKEMREEYEKEWHRKNDPIIAKTIAETTTFRAPEHYNETREHMWNFFNAVKSRKPVVENEVFGNWTAIACHMANVSYFKKNIAYWDDAARDIRTAAS
jgi:predicted dehydrogenase